MPVGAITGAGAKRADLHASTLPYFRYTEGERLHRYTCMRRDCGQSFYTAELLAGAPTASCPHCFRVSRLPTPRIQP